MCAYSSMNYLRMILICFWFVHFWQKTNRLCSNCSKMNKNAHFHFDLFKIDWKRTIWFFQYWFVHFRSKTNKLDLNLCVFAQFWLFWFCYFWNCSFLLIFDYVYFGNWNCSFSLIFDYFCSCYFWNCSFLSIFDYFYFGYFEIIYFCVYLYNFVFVIVKLFILALFCIFYSCSRWFN